MTTGCLLLRRTIRLSALVKAVGYPLFLKAFLRWRISILLATFAVANVSCCLHESANVCTSQYGWVCDKLESVALLVPCHQTGKYPVFFNLPHKFDGGLSAVEVNKLSSEWMKVALAIIIKVPAMLR